MNDKEKQICNNLLRIIKDLVPPADLNKQDELDIQKAELRVRETI